jgi:hypothetical protein
MGAIAVTTAACSGNIEEPTSSDFSEIDRLAQSADNLRRSIDPAKELMITDLSVIESPTHTTFDPAHPSGGSFKGAWSFGRLIHNMLPAGSRDDAAAASAFVFNWLGQWEADQAPQTSGLVLALSGKRTDVRSKVIDPWKTASGCSTSAPDSACVLDMGKAPFRLVAIVNRPDLRKLPTATDPGFGGEGRFVFNLLVDGKPVKGTVIFEYSLPIYSKIGTLTWAYRFHLLGSLPFGQGYNNLLALITNGFSGADADPRRPNGNALNQLRTNELALKHTAGCHPDGSMLPTGLCKPLEASAFPRQKLWELREFHITADGKMTQVPMNQEPSRDFDVFPRVDGTRSIGDASRKNLLAKFMYENQAAVAAGTHTIPAEWKANSTYVGSGVPQWGTKGNTAASGVGFTYVDPAGVSHDIPEAVRAGFALQTCGGCHRHEVNAGTGAAATKTFLHITDPRALDPSEANDQDAIAEAAGTRNTILSDFVKKEIQAGGPRYNDFASLLNIKEHLLAHFKGLKVCSTTVD